MQYNANSIIFFKGDVSDRVFLLNSGKVTLNYTDIETGQEIHDLIKTGEFFGVKSALGRYPREETAQVLTESAVIAFTVPQFEQLAMQNTRIIMKMLKVFSNQLRRVHKQVQNLIYTEEQIKPESGLYGIGDYYLKNKRYSQALYAFKRYLTYYPSGRYSAEVTQKLQQAEEYLQRYGQGKGPGPEKEDRAGAAAAAGEPPQSWAKPSAGATGRGEPPKGEMSEVAKLYYNAVSLMSQQKYQDAFTQFKKIVADGHDAEYTAKGQYELSRCLYYMQQFDGCIQSFGALIQKYPKHPDLREALFFVGKCYEAKKDAPKARGFYSKILSLVSEEDPLARKVKKALRDLQEG
jgi:TolA-binding protein/CRP-like cAMP-binding protein